MECGAAPDTVGAAPPGILAISRTDTGCQRSASSATSTWDWMSPQPVAGSRGISFWPFAPMSTTCGGITARAGQTVPGWCATEGWRRALISPARPESDRCSVAVFHRPLPGMVWAPFTHRSTLTGTKDTGSDTLVAPVGQPAQAGSPATTRPPLTVGTGVAGRRAATPATPRTDAPTRCAPRTRAARRSVRGRGGAAAVCALPHPAASAPAASSGRGDGPAAASRAGQPEPVSPCDR